jgi:hypothetical protein
MSDIVPTVVAQNGIHYWPALHPALRGKARHIRRINRKFHRFFLFTALSPIGRVRIEEPIVLAQNKGNKRIGKARTPIHHALPTVIEIAC